ncbi:hypothetical protein ACIQ7Q_34275 [Streptomyces sp. NPDC096176]|uniref:hypothetical protein n=1 Tax=Streptomyces sp. NPDC096176 TaxID=3366079 RepID=UPI00380C700F
MSDEPQHPDHPTDPAATDHGLHFGAGDITIGNIRTGSSTGDRALFNGQAWVDDLYSTDQPDTPAFIGERALFSEQAWVDTPDVFAYVHISGEENELPSHHVEELRFAEEEDEEAWAPLGDEETEEEREELVARIVRDGEALRRELGLPGFPGTPADPRPTPGTSTETKTGARTGDESAPAPRGRRQPRRPGGRRAIRRVRRALDYPAAVSRTINRLRMLGAVLQLTLMTLGIVALGLAVFRGTTPDIVRAIGACACVVALLGRRALRRAVVRARHTLARGVQMYLGEQLDDHRHAGDRKEV